MSLFKKIIHECLSYLIALLKLVIFISLLAIAKVTLRTNPDIAIPVLSTAAAIFFLWLFAPKIKSFLDL
ncbi:MAG: hypothetical protein PSN04_04890 [Methyloprofundus sp.]|nr:hypothetical protein [Methyloprofundus sp.]